MHSDDDVILGGDTPFVPASEAYRAFGADHRPLGMSVEGREATRGMHLIMCAMMWNIAKEKPMPDISHEEFMRQYIAGANHDLRAMGFPMLSITEVRRWADSDAIRSASTGGV